MLGLLALAWQGQNKTSQALTALEKRLSLAEPEGYVRVFLDEGLPMAALLKAGIERDMIYGKLGAQSGTQAIARARELNLL